MTDQAQIKSIAQQVMWWQSPDVTLANPRRFLAQVMTLGTWREVQATKAAYGWEAFKDALGHAPAGVFDPRSWAYWHNFLGLPEAALPCRSFS
jgi:hypothetical protein